MPDINQEIQKEDTNNSSTLAEKSEGIIMLDPAIVKTFYKGAWYELIFNETILLLEKNSEIDIKFSKKISDWTIKFKFNDTSTATNWLSGLPPEKNYKLNIENNNITFILNNWYSDQGTENQVAEPINSTDKTIKLLVKFRSAANNSQDIRTLIVSIWQAA